MFRGPPSLLLFLVACTPGVGPIVDAGDTPEDAGPALVDAGPPCGELQPDVSGIAGVEGLVVASDGTFYFSQNAAVGRLTAAGELDRQFVPLPGANTVWGLVLDESESALFVGSPSTSRVYRIDLDTRAFTFFAQDGPNGFARAEDGTVFFSDFFEGHVYRIVDDTPVRVTAAAIAQANGLVFTDEGTLLVASYASGDLVELTLEAGLESSRQTVASGFGNPDGLALDDEGRIYVTDNTGGTLERFARGSPPETLLSGMSAPASIAFGAGPVRCTDVYVAANSGLHRFEADAPAR